MPRRSPADTLAEIKSAIREPYVWPGGYPRYILMADGGALSVQSARENWAQICHATITRDHGGWRAAGADINWEDADLVCAHSGEPIECAYPPDTDDA